MREQLRAYIDRLFAETVQTQAARDFHDELLQNTLDRFDDDVASGKSEQEAYRLAVLSLGNTEELLKPFYPKARNTGAFRTTAIVLYATSVVPVILFGSMHFRPSTLGVTLMFWMIAIATMLIIMAGKARPTEGAEQAKTLRAVGVALLIASVTAVFIGVGYEEIRAIRLVPVSGAVLGVCGMFATIAAGIALLVTAGQKDTARTVPHVPVQRETPVAQTFAQPQPETASEMKPVMPKGLRIAGGIISAVYWVFIVCVFFSVSFSTGAWYYTWLVFVFAGGLYDIVSGVVRLCCGMEGLLSVIDGILAIAAGALFYYLTVATGMWIVTWLVFPIQGCLHGVIDGIIKLAKTTGKES